MTLQDIILFAYVLFHVQLYCVYGADFVSL